MGAERSAPIFHFPALLGRTHRPGHVRGRSGFARGDNGRPFHLAPDSPRVDAGSNEATRKLHTDLGHRPRVIALETPTEGAQQRTLPAKVKSSQRLTCVTHSLGGIRRTPIRRGAQDGEADPSSLDPGPAFWSIGFRRFCARNTQASYDSRKLMTSIASKSRLRTSARSTIW
jgi:hypothetical protein